MDGGRSNSQPGERGREAVFEEERTVWEGKRAVWDRKKLCVGGEGAVHSSNYWECVNIC